MLNAPNLESLVYLGFRNRFRIGPEHSSEKIKLIVCTLFETNSNFPCLEHLICQTPDSFLSLEKLPMLKLIELLPKKAADFDIIENLKMQKRLLNRKELDIWICGFKENYISDLIPDRGVIYLNFNRNAQFDHFDYDEPLSVVPWEVCFFSPQLTRKFPDLEGIPKKFFEVFIRIKKLVIYEKVDCRKLIWFLKKARHVGELTVSQNEFDECFFRELCQIQSIRYLSISGSTTPLIQDSHYDMGFFFGIGNFQNIKSMTIRIGGFLQIPAHQFTKFLRATKNHLKNLEISADQFISIDHSTYCDPKQDYVQRPSPVYKFMASCRKMVFYDGAWAEYENDDPDHDQILNEEGYDFDEEEGIIIESMDELVALIEKLPGKNTIFI